MGGQADGPPALPGALPPTAGAAGRRGSGERRPSNGERRRSEQARGSPLSYTFEFDWADEPQEGEIDRVHAVPTFDGSGGESRRPASRLEAFLAVALVRGRLAGAPPGAVLPAPWLACFLQEFGGDESAARDVVTLTAWAREVNAARWAIGADLKKMLREARAAGVRAPVCAPQLLISGFPSHITEGEELRSGVVIELRDPPQLLRPGGVLLQLSCPTLGVQVVPPEARLGAGRMSARFSITGRTAGLHEVAIRVTGVNAADFPSPAPLPVSVQGRDQAVYGAMADALCLLLDHNVPGAPGAAEGRPPAQAFQRCVRRLLQNAAGGSCRGLVRAMAQRGLLRLLLATLNAMPDEALTAVSGDSVFHGFPVWGRQPLHAAMLLGDAELAARLLATGECDGAQATSAVAAALLGRQTAAAKRFLSLRPAGSCEGPLPGGDTAVCVAARHGDCEGLRALIAEGADVSYVTPQGSTPLLLAAEAHPPGSVGSPTRRRIVSLIVTSPKLTWDGKAGRRNASMAAKLAAACRPAELSLLLSAGCPPSGSSRPPPLYAAVDSPGVLPAAESPQPSPTPSGCYSRQQTEVSRQPSAVPRQLSALPSAMPRQASSLPRQASERSEARLEEEVELPGLPDGGLPEARELCVYALAQACSDQRAQSAIDASGPDGVTALSRAVQLRDRGCVTVLLEAGASVSARDDDGRNALHHALLPRHRRKEPKAASPRTPAGAAGGEGPAVTPPPQPADPVGCDVPLPECAAAAAAAVAVLAADGCAEAAADAQLVLQLLSAAKGKADVQDRWGQTPTHLACGGGKGGKVVLNLCRAMVVDHGFRVSAADAAGRTPLHCVLRRALKLSSRERAAVLPDIAACAEHLAGALPAGDEGALVLAKEDRDGHTVLVLALRLGLLELVELLCKRWGPSAEGQWCLRHDPGSKGLTPLLSALLHGGDTLTAEDRSKAEALSLAVLSCAQCDLGPCRRRPYFRPLHVAAARRYSAAIRRMLAKGATCEACRLGHTPMSALCRVSPYDTPESGTGLPSELDSALRAEIGKILIDLPSLDLNQLSPLWLVEVDGEPPPFYSIVQLACTGGLSDVLRLVCGSPRLTWSWDRERSQPAEHPLVLLLRSRAGWTQKNAGMHILLARHDDDLRSCPAVLTRAVHGCVSCGLYEPLSSLVAIDPSVVNSPLPGGTSLLQLALHSTAFPQENLSRRQAVCEELLAAGADINRTGSSRGVATVLQRAVILQLWRLVTNLCRPDRGCLGHLTTEAEPTPAILLLLRGEGEPDDVLGALKALLGTGCAVEGQRAPEEQKAPSDQGKKEGGGSEAGGGPEDCFSVVLSDMEEEASLAGVELCDGAPTPAGDDGAAQGQQQQQQPGPESGSDSHASRSQTAAEAVAEPAEPVDTSVRDEVAVLCCSKGLAPALPMLHTVGLLPPPPTAKRGDGVLLAHAAVLAPEPPESPQQAPAEAPPPAAAEQGAGEHAALPTSPLTPTSPEVEAASPPPEPPTLGPAASLAALQELGWLKLCMEARDADGRTPLLHSFWHGRCAAAKWLIEAGADAHAAGEDGQTALHCIAISPHYEDEEQRRKAVGILARNGTTLPLPNGLHKGETPLHAASRQGFVELVRALTEFPAVSVNVLDAAGRTPLLAALYDTESCPERRGRVATILLRHQHSNPSLGKSSLPTVHGLLAGYPVGPGTRPQRELLGLLLRQRKGGESSPHVPALLARRDRQGRTAILAGVQALTEAGDSGDAARYADAASVLELMLSHPQLPGELLSAAGADAEAPLHHLARHAHQQRTPTVVLALLSKRADAGGVDAEGLRPLQRALVSLRSISSEQVTPATETTVALVLRALCESPSFSPTWLDAEGRTLLHLCVLLPAPQLAALATKCILGQYRLHFGSDVNAIDSDGWSPLTRLLQGKVLPPEGADAALHELLQLPELTPIFKGVQGSVLHYALRRRCVALTRSCLGSPGLRRYLERGRDIWELLDAAGGTVLHAALSHGSEMEPECVASELVALLQPYSRHWRLGAPDSSGLSPIVLAAQQRQWHTLRALLASAPGGDDACAPAAYSSPSGLSVLHYALDDSELSPAEVLEWAELLTPVMCLNIKDTDTLRDSNGSTVLYYAANRGLPDVCAFLIASCGCSATAAQLKRGGKRTPLHGAASGPPETHQAVSDILLSDRVVAAIEREHKGMGCPFDIGDADGATPAMIAAASGQLDTLTRLLQLGSDLGTLDNAGRCPLLYALAEGQIECATEYLRTAAQSAYGNARVCASGGPALRLAAERCRSPELVRSLLAAGCDPVSGDPPALVAALRLYPGPQRDAVVVADTPDAEEAGLSLECWYDIVRTLAQASRAAAEATATAAAAAATPAQPSAGWPGSRLGGSQPRPAALPGLQELPCVSDPIILECFLKGQPAQTVAHWACSALLPPREEVDTEYNAAFVQSFKEYWSLPCGFGEGVEPPSPEAVTAALSPVRFPDVPPGGGAALGPEGAAALACLLRFAGCDVLAHSSALRNRVGGVLLPPRYAPRRAFGEVSSTFPGCSDSDFLTLANLPSAAALLLCLGDPGARRRIVTSSAQAEATEAAARLLHGAVVFGCDDIVTAFNTTAPDVLRNCCAPPAGDALELAVAELGGPAAVSAVLGVRGKHGTELGLAACEAFCRRPEEEQFWEVFEVLFNHRTPLTGGALMYCVEHDKVRAVNCLGDTLLHLLALNRQEHLVGGLIRQVPSLHEVGVDPDARNVFGKRALDYTNDMAMASAIRDLTRPLRLREAHGLAGKRAPPVPVPLDLTQVQRGRSPSPTDGRSTPGSPGPVSDRSAGRSPCPSSRPGTAMSARIPTTPATPSRASTPFPSARGGPSRAEMGGAAHPPLQLTPRGIWGQSSAVAQSRRPLAFEEEGVVRYDPPPDPHRAFDRGRRRRPLHGRVPLTAGRAEQMRAMLNRAAKYAAAERATRVPAPPSRPPPDGRGGQRRGSRAASQRIRRGHAGSHPQPRPAPPSGDLGAGIAAWQTPIASDGLPRRGDAVDAAGPMPGYYDVRAAAAGAARAGGRGDHAKGSWDAADLSAGQSIGPPRQRSEQQRKAGSRGRRGSSRKPRAAPAGGHDAHSGPAGGSAAAAAKHLRAPDAAAVRRAPDADEWRGW
eukprot:TRINITY_DN8239_c0_g2_i1.p1 TRINITY_DN8239_c0_g2~~TRINITY_DN8239_c0_g2_i1.p1  ORF type:complete len:3160 (+),score=875.93 TRINITY_DN8239_c0_g2_i1:88-9480(+)